MDAGFHPVRRLVETRCGIRDDASPPERLACLRKELTDLGLDPDEMVTFLAPVLGIDPSAGYAPATTEGRKLEEQVAQAALDYVVACTRGEPAILVAEDLHWFDDATRELLAELMHSGPGNLLVFATSRTAEPGAWETIELRPLTHAGRLELIDALSENLPEEDRLALAARSDGVPLYIEELVQAGASASSSDSGAPVPGAVPAALYEPLVARLYATPKAMPVAAAAAAAGQEVDRSLLAEVDVDRRRASSLRRCATSSTHRSCCRSPAAVPGFSSATSCCARSPTSCSRLRGAARSTAGSGISSAATR